MSDLRDDFESAVGRGAIRVVEAMRRKSAERNEARRQQVRDAMGPELAAFVDEVRALSGPETKVEWLKTDALELGKPGERGIPLSDVVIGPPAPAAQPSRAGKRS